jgi:hypothetical protein
MTARSEPKPRMISVSSRPDRRVAILQSCYIPWKGYFDIIGSVDVFVIYDDVQYSKNHWHNRNLIKTQHGTKWLTVPVSKADGAFQKIEDVRLPQPFAAKHWQTISQAYARAPHYARYESQLGEFYRKASETQSLSELNALFLKAISDLLGLATKFVWSRDLAASGVKTDRLLAICQELGANRYLSGPAAKSYFEMEKFDAAGIAVDWMDYSGYPQYPQLHGPFEHGVSIIDLLFSVGPEARDYMKMPVAPGLDN